MQPETLWKTRFFVGLLAVLLYLLVPSGYVSYNNCEQLTGVIYDIVFSGSCLSIRDPNSYTMMLVFVAVVPLLLLSLATISTRRAVGKESIPNLTRILAKGFIFFVIFCLVIEIVVLSPSSSRWSQNGITVLSWFPLAALVDIPVVAIYCYRTFEHPRFKALDFKKYQSSKVKPGEIVIDEKWAAPVRKSILELGTKFTRLQVAEIAERVKGLRENQIIAVVEDMIRRGQIVAEYFQSTRSVAFDQQANTQVLAKFIADLDGQFTEWGKDGKKA